MAMLALGLLAGAGCKKDAGSSKAQSASPKQVAPQAPVAVPREVTAYLGLRNPQSSLDDLLGIVREFAPVPVDRNGLLDLLAQRAHLPRELLASIDATGTFWLVVLDDKQVGERDPGLLVFPLRSRHDFEASLNKRMKRAGREGELTRYAPRAGEVGLSEVRLLLSDRHLVVPSSRKVLELCLPFVRRNLLEHPPSYDFALHLLTEHLAADPRNDLQQRIDRAMERLRSNVPQPSSATGIDRMPMASAAEDALHYYGEVLKSTREVIVTGDVDPSQITVAVRAEGKPGGLLQKLVQRQHPGPVFGKALLPGSSWLVLSNRSNPEAAAERQKTWAATVHSMFRKLSPGQADRFQAALVELGRRLSGDVTLAVHRAPSGTGITLTALAEVKGQGESAREAMEQLADVTVEWLKEQARKEQDATMRNLKLLRRPFDRDGTKGSVFSMSLRYPEARREELTRLLGAQIGVGWAFRGELAAFCVGKEVEEQLAAIAASTAGGKLAGGLADTAAFRRAHNATPTRIGLLYVSLLDLARWFEGSGIVDAEEVSAALKKAHVSSAPSIDWGVNATRTQLDVTMHLPVEHLRAFKPIFDAFMSKRAERMLGSPSAP